jgi:hypothetical protein
LAVLGKEVDMSKMTEAKIKKLIQGRKQGMSCKQLGDKFGIHETYAAKLCRDNGYNPKPQKPVVNYHGDQRPRKRKIDPMAVDRVRTLYGILGEEIERL